MESREYGIKIEGGAEKKSIEDRRKRRIVGKGGKTLGESSEGRMKEEKGL